MTDQFGPDLRFPHCDARVLHAPYECDFCDLYPQRQQRRLAQKIAFTGEVPEPGSSPCPSDEARGLAGAHVWVGNRPKPVKMPEITQEHIELLQLLRFAVSGDRGRLPGMVGEIECVLAALLPTGTHVLARQGPAQGLLDWATEQFNDYAADVQEGGSADPSVLEMPNTVLRAFEAEGATGIINTGHGWGLNETDEKQI